jgi:predicted nucleic acid-binding protein
VILADTCVWIEHLRRPQPELAEALEGGSVLVHPLVIEELACGLPDARSQLLADLAKQPRAPQASHEEVLRFIEMHGLAGTGVGAIDVHLLASALLAGARLLTLDAALLRAARKLGVAA